MVEQKGQWYSALTLLQESEDQKKHWERMHGEGVIVSSFNHISTEIEDDIKVSPQPSMMLYQQKALNKCGRPGC